MGDPLYSSDDRLDIAYMPNALQQPKIEFFPILSPEGLHIGENVYTAGFFLPAGGDGTVYTRLSLGQNS